MRWRPWQPTKKSAEQLDGHTVIYTELLSTTGIPVQIAIPVKSPKGTCRNASPRGHGGFTMGATQDRGEAERLSERQAKPRDDAHCSRR
jgi:hypothetical protein